MRSAHPGHVRFCRIRKGLAERTVLTTSHDQLINRPRGQLVTWCRSHGQLTELLQKRLFRLDLLQLQQAVNSSLRTDIQQQHSNARNMIQNHLK